MIKLIHTADIMFDAPMRFKDSSKAGIKREEVRESFIKMLEYADEKAVDLLLISGNLFDRRNVTKSTYDFLKEQFSRHPGLGIFIMPGRLDPYYPDSAYLYGDLGENVYVFTGEDITSFSLETAGGDKVTVYGSAYTSSAFYTSELGRIRCADDDRINILMWGGDPADGVEGSNIHDISLTGIDYAALGECSLEPGINCEDGMWYAYPGVLDPTTFDLPGKNGFVYFECYKESGDLICRHKHISVSKRRFISADIDVTGALDTGAICLKVKEYFESGTDTQYSGNILRLTLKGDVSPEAEIDTEKTESIAYSYGLFDFVLVDETLPVYNYEYLSSDPTIKGAFFNTFRAALSSSDKGEREKAAAALRLGIAAMNGKKFGAYGDEQ